jgi:hypothetical protein
MFIRNVIRDRELRDSAMVLDIFGSEGLNQYRER